MDQPPVPASLVVGTEKEDVSHIAPRILEARALVCYDENDCLVDDKRIDG